MPSRGEKTLCRETLLAYSGVESNNNNNRPANSKLMNDSIQPALLVVPRKRKACQLFNPKEFKLLSLRECPTPAEMQLCDTPDKAAEYWRQHVTAHPCFNPDVETFVVVLVNTRRKIQGHCLISTGTLDTILVHPREVFRPAVIGAAAAIVVMHNHPSGDPTPSEADIKVTRDLIRAGQILKIEVLDHVVMGQSGEGKGYVSLRELGYFYS
jgi:DNA repair protein RadC